MIVSEKKQQVAKPECVFNILRSILSSEHETDRDKEHFWVIGLDTKKNIKYVDLVSLGTLNQSLVHPREIFRLAILKGVDCIILAHNHPSGEVAPSASDYQTTEKIVEAGELLGIKVIDHIVIGDSYYSFKEHGFIE